jgi:transposase
MSLQTPPMAGGRSEVLCHSGASWAGRLLGRLLMRLLLTFAYSWPTPSRCSRQSHQHALDAIVARPVWWRGRARTLVAELLNSPPAESPPS